MGPGLPYAVDAPHTAPDIGTTATVATALTAVARRGVVALLPIHYDGLLVNDGHGGHQAGVGVIRVKGEWVAAAELEVHHGADGNRLEDLHHLGMSIAQDDGVIHTDYHVTCKSREEGEGRGLDGKEGRVRRRG